VTPHVSTDFEKTKKVTKILEEVKTLVEEPVLNIKPVEELSTVLSVPKDVVKECIIDETTQTKCSECQRFIFNNLRINIRLFRINYFP
jgi:hypothetical protein